MNEFDNETWDGTPTRTYFSNKMNYSPLLARTISENTHKDQEAQENLLRLYQLGPVQDFCFP